VDSHHLHALGLVCPACRRDGRGDQPLTVAQISRAEADDLVEGMLACPHAACRCLHPIIDGIPVVVADLPAWLRHQLDAVLRRRDLSPAVQALLGDEPGTVLDDARRTASTYATAHHADTTDGYPALVRVALALAPPTDARLALDLGCAVGRGTFELAAAGARIAIGVDLDFHMLSIAERARTTGVARYERRTIGTVYAPCADAIAGAEIRARTGFLCADALALPVPSATVDHALALNLVDCVASPRRLLDEVARVLAPAGDLVIATPYDWSTTATPQAAWLGGRNTHDAQPPEAALRAAIAAAQLGVVAERASVPWRLRVHARAVMEYAVHVVHTRRS
jgi:SAM-dependent methyltransferase